MSIDAKIDHVKRAEDGSGMLHLIPRDDRFAPAGQQSLVFVKSPLDVHRLQGREIWGGSSEVMCGDVKIARRIGYTGIQFTVPDFRDLP
jgi:hypothetical protein